MAFDAAVALAIVDDDDDSKKIDEDDDNDDDVENGWWGKLKESRLNNFHIRSVNCMYNRFGIAQALLANTSQFNPTRVQFCK